ncbi:Glycine oxidase [Carnimonas sp. R-84981]|uniref:NAD(P)/FAD-dependent oxidoreductase n=1 Tax=Carnimonas bestiolae TaxID=3402172 RepID=UPI003EDB916C
MLDASASTPDRHSPHSASHHVTVIGAGIIGASIAYHLARRHAKVTLVEKHTPAQATTRTSFAWLNANSKTPYDYYRLNYDGLLGWYRLQQELPDAFDIQWGGSVAWCSSDADEIAALAHTVREHQPWGYPIHDINAAELQRLLPQVSTGEFGGGWHSSVDGTLDPVAATQALVSAACAYGAELVQADVTGLATQQTRVTEVVTAHGQWATDAVIIAAGNDTPALAEQLGIAVPMLDSYGILAHSTPVEKRLPRILLPSGADIKQNPDGRVVTGENFGDSGATPATEAVGQALLDKAGEFLPELGRLTLDFVTRGKRVLPVDERPIIGTGADIDNAYVAVTHSGITLAPVIGQLLAIEVLDGIATEQLAPFRPTRFDGVER